MNNRTIIILFGVFLTLGFILGFMVSESNKPTIIQPVDRSYLISVSSTTGLVAVAAIKVDKGITINFSSPLQNVNAIALERVSVLEKEDKVKK